MDLNSLQQWLEFASGAAALIAGLVTALWAYAKFILERGLLPPVQFNLDCKTIGLQTDRKVLEILLHLKNLGTSTLVATNIRVDVLYLDSTDEPSLFKDLEKPTFGRLRFPRSLRKELWRGDVAQTPANPASCLGENHVAETGEKRGIGIVPHDTFVQPGVDQVYTLVTAVPESTTYVLVWASFQYAQHPSLLQRFILFLSRRLGLIQFSLDHIKKPHTAERVFKVLEPKAEEEPCTVS
jgi:hypothetical protein